MKSNQYFEVDKYLKKLNLSSGNPNETAASDDDDSHRRFLLIILFLVGALITAALGITYYLHRKNAERDNITTNIPIEILIRGEKTNVLHLAGIVRYTDGTPVSNRKVVLHSDVRTDKTDANGYVAFDHIPLGEHLIEVYSEDGKKVVASKRFTVERKDIDSFVCDLGEDGIIVFSIALDVRLIEITLDMNRDTNKMVISSEEVCVINSAGTVISQSGFINSDEGVILTPKHHLLVSDQTIFLPSVKDGKRWIITNEDEIVSADPGNYDGYSVREDGTAVLPSGVILTPDGTVYLPDGEEVDPGITGVLIDEDFRVTPIGSKKQPTAEVITLNGEKSTASGQEIMDSKLEPMVVTDLYPGDSATKYYCIRVQSPEAAGLRFYVKVNDKEAKLNDVLKVKATRWEADENGKYSICTVLYDGLMTDMEAEISSDFSLWANVPKTKTDIFYEVTVYLPTSATVEYAEQSLDADFLWEVIG